MDAKWYAPPDRPIQTRGVPPVMGVAGVCVSTLLFPRGKLPVGLATPLLIYFISQQRWYSSGKIHDDYLNSINMAAMIGKYVDFVVLGGGPKHDLQRTAASSPTTRHVDDDTSKMTLWQRLTRSLSFWGTLRGIGWNWQVKNSHEVAARASRRQALMGHVAGFVQCYLTLDIIQHCLFSSPYCQLGTSDFWDTPFARQALLGWLTGMQGGVGLGFVYHLAAMLGLASGLMSPQEWPPIFGEWSRCYSLRRFWGYCYHQFLRRLFFRTTTFMTSALRVRPGTLASRYIQLYGAFFVSACIHHLGALNLPYSPEAAGQFLFFMVQPVAITVEDLVVDLAQRLGIRENGKRGRQHLRPVLTKPIVWTHLFGYAWIIGHFTFWLRLGAACHFGWGLGGVRHPLIWSIVDRVI